MDQFLLQFVAGLQEQRKRLNCKIEVIRGFDYFFCDSFRNNIFYCSIYLKAHGGNYKTHHKLMIGLGLQDEDLTELHSGALQTKEMNVIPKLYNYIVAINTLANACLGIQNVKKVAKDRLYE